jgi:hypothetical protein
VTSLGEDVSLAYPCGAPIYQLAELVIPLFLCGGLARLFPQDGVGQQAFVASSLGALGAHSYRQGIFGISSRMTGP